MEDPSYVRTRVFALADVDGDGDLDLVLGNQPSANGSGWRNRLHRNDGIGRFTDVTSATMPPDGDHTEDLALADVEGDGDLVFGNRRARWDAPGSCRTSSCTNPRRRRGACRTSAFASSCPDQ